MSGTLLMAHEYMTNLLAGEQRVVEGQNGPIGHAEDIGLPIETYDYLVLPIVLRAFQEFGVRKFCPNFRTDFNMNLLKILNLDVEGEGEEEVEAVATAKSRAPKQETIEEED